MRVQDDLHFSWKTVAVLASAPPPDLEASFWVGEMRDKERQAQIEFFAFLRVGTRVQSCSEENGCSNVEQDLRVQ